MEQGTASHTARSVEYPALTADIERDWRTRFGDARVTALQPSCVVATPVAEIPASLDELMDPMRLAG